MDTPHGGYVVHVDDVAEAVVAAVGNYSVGGQVLNLVDDYVYDQDVATLAQEMTESPSVIYDRKSELLKTLVLTGYEKYLDKYWRAARMAMVNHQSGKETDLLWTDYAFGNGFKESDFTQTSLKRAK